MSIYLTKPTLKLRESYLDFYNDWKMAGERMSPKVLGRFDPIHFEEMIQRLNEMSMAKRIPEGQIPESVYWLVNKNNQILGAVTIRHELTKKLRNTEGHIGAGIRPSERGKGYGTNILQLALDEMRKMGFQKALVTCNECNIASEKAIINNGGVNEEDFIEESGNKVRRYWIMF